MSPCYGHRSGLRIILFLLSLLVLRSVVGFSRNGLIQRRPLHQAIRLGPRPDTNYAKLVPRHGSVELRASMNKQEDIPWFSSRIIQWPTALAVYLFHLTVSSKLMVRRLGMGYDAAIGGVTLIGLMLFRMRKPLRTVFRLPDLDDTRFRLSTVFSLIALFFGYLQTGKFSLFWEDTILELSNDGWPITVSSAQALQVLFSHLTWSLAVVLILAVIPFPGVFRPRMKDTADILQKDIPNDRAHYWFTWKSRNWLHWASVGFLASNGVFAIADALNHRILPTLVISQPTPSVVSQLVVGDWLGCIAPCVTAPFLEELLYRGFVWPAVTTLLGGNGLVANFCQGLVFSAHHVSTTGAIPLAALGFFWAWLYRASGSLATVVAVHVMWNARVFVSAWLLGC